MCCCINYTSYRWRNIMMIKVLLEQSLKMHTYVHTYICIIHKSSFFLSLLLFLSVLRILLFFLFLMYINLQTHCLILLRYKKEFINLCFGNNSLFSPCVHRSFPIHLNSHLWDIMTDIFFTFIIWTVRNKRWSFLICI